MLSRLRLHFQEDKIHAYNEKLRSTNFHILSAFKGASFEMTASSILAWIDKHPVPDLHSLFTINRLYRGVSKVRKLSSYVKNLAKKLCFTEITQKVMKLA